MTTLLSLLLLAVLAAAPQAAEDGEASTDKEQLLRDMQARAKATSVWVYQDDQRSPAKLVDVPLFRYSDQPRHIVDATLWAWQSGGRPVAFQKVEVYRKPGPTLRWFYCFASASPRRIEADWPAAEPFRAKKPAIELRTLAGVPPAGETPLRRLRQMKQIARRFSLTIKDRIADTQEKMRLLPQPIHRYGKDSDNTRGESNEEQSEKSSLLDGAVFGFASNGTNPDALLLVELHGDGANSVWKHALVQMTTGELTARFDDKQVWSAPYRVAGRDSRFETWLFFKE